MNGEPGKKRIKLQYEQNMQFRAKYSNNGTFIAHLIYIKVQKRVMLLCIWLINFELKLWRTFGINHDTDSSEQVNATVCGLWDDNYNCIYLIKKSNSNTVKYFQI